MSLRTDSDVIDVLDGALNSFSDAMKAGVKAQEEIVKWWSAAVNGPNPMSDWQKRSRAILDTLPAAQQQAEEWVKVVEQNYKRSVDLLKKAVDADGNGNAAGLRDRTRKLWEESLSVVKDNAESMAEANVKMMELFTNMLRKNLDQGEEAIKAATASAKAAAASAAATAASAAQGK